MCTTGVLRLGPNDYVLFKNKDFGRTRFDDRIVLEREVFGVEGITTWADDDPGGDRFSGFSIGANSAGLLACDSNVRTLPDHANYDDLVEIALREGHDVPSAVDSVRAAVESTPYLWGNLIMIDSSQSAAIEVRGTHAEVVHLTGPTARTNHHVVLGAHPDDDDTTTTGRRLAAAQRRVEQARSIADVWTLLEAHDDGDTGICNHTVHQTVYSYVLRRRSDRTILSVGRGHPCEQSPRSVLEIPLGGEWTEQAAEAFRAAYPSADPTSSA